MFELPDMQLHMKVVRFTASCQSTDKILPRSRLILMNEWQREILHVVEEKHVEPFRAEHSELLVLAVKLNSFFEVQELLADPEGM